MLPCSKQRLLDLLCNAYVNTVNISLANDSADTLCALSFTIANDATLNFLKMVFPNGFYDT